MTRSPRLAPALLLAVILSLNLAPAPLSAADVLSGTARVIDGDTVEIRGRRVRLHGIDAPESGEGCRDASRRIHGCGKAATRALASVAQGVVLACEIRDRDRYGRLVAVCRRGSADLNGWMVRQGHALAYRSFSRDYVPEEKEARRQRAGIWQGRFDAPWDWRRAQARLPSRQAQPSAVDPSASTSPSAGTAKTAPSPGEGDGCTIKGNISPSGKIYHFPGSAWYDRTGISEDRGERWFCSEEEARAAGWRRPRR